MDFAEAVFEIPGIDVSRFTEELQQRIQGSSLFPTESFLDSLLLECGVKARILFQHGTDPPVGSDLKELTSQLQSLHRNLVVVLVNLPELFVRVGKPRGLLGLGPPRRFQQDDQLLCCGVFERPNFVERAARSRGCRCGARQQGRGLGRGALRFPL